MKTIRSALLAVSLAVGSMLAVGGLTVGVAAAQDEPDAAEDRAMAFEAAEGAQTENIPGGALMVGAYGLVWLFLLGYVVSLGYRSSRTRDEIERLRAEIESAKRRSGG